MDAGGFSGLERDLESGATELGGVAHLNGAPVTIDDGFDEGKANANTAGAPGSAAVETYEAFKDALTVLRADSRSVIFNCRSRRRRSSSGHGHHHATRGMGDCVIHQIDHHLLDLRGHAIGSRHCRAIQ